MKLRTIALDYDGTIAVHGALEPAVRTAALEARARGVRVLIVTGRIVSELERVAGALDWVDGVVAENGAVVWLPERGAGTVLATAPPPALVEQLAARGHAVLTGACVVDLDAGAAHDAIEVIRALELPHVLQFNQDRLMLLPQGTSKAAGLRALLELLGLSRHEMLAVGNAENDHVLLATAGYGVAVAWGSAALAAAADHVLAGDGPRAVAAMMRSFLAREWLPPPRATRDALTLGTTSDGHAIAVPARGNLIVAGENGTGRSWLARRIAEQHLLARRPTVLLDTAGGLAGLDVLSGVTAAEDHALPGGIAFARMLERADAGLWVAPAQKARHERHAYVTATLAVLGAARRDGGRPHAVVVDELVETSAVQDPTTLAWDRGGWTLVVRRATALPPELLRSATVVVTRETDGEEIEALQQRLDAPLGSDWAAALSSRPVGEAVRLDPAGPRVFRVEPTLTAPPN